MSDTNDGTPDPAKATTGVTNIAKELREQLLDILELIQPRGMTSSQFAADRILELFTATLSQLEGELPEKKINREYPQGGNVYTQDRLDGYNQALAEVHTIIKKYREGLK